MFVHFLLLYMIQLYIERCFSHLSLLTFFSLIFPKFFTVIQYSQLKTVASLIFSYVNVSKPKVENLALDCKHTFKCFIGSPIYISLKRCILQHIFTSANEPANTSPSSRNECWNFSCVHNISIIFNGGNN